MMVLVGIRSTAATAAAFLRVSTCAPVLHKAFHLRPLVLLAQDISRREESPVLEVFLVANDDDAIHKLGEITQLIDHLLAALGIQAAEPLIDDQRAHAANAVACILSDACSQCYRDAELLTS